MPRDERQRKGYGEEAVEAEGNASPTSSPPPASDRADSSAPSAPKEEEEKKVESELQDLVAGLERERDEYLSLAQRTKADFENYRKRVSREAVEAEARGRATLARNLLSVVDNLERALAAGRPRDDDSTANHIAQGIRLVYEELSGVLSDAGVESFEPTGERFDPDQHEAMMTKPGKEGAVVEVLQKGYRLNGRVLRPARVVVGAGQESGMDMDTEPGKES
jgi:molecular chaperone GrpE